MAKTTSSNTTLRPLAIVTGKNYASRLGMVRAAGMAGCDVVVVQTQLKWMTDTPIDTYSKYVVETKVAHQPDANLVVETIMGYRGKRQTIFILPTDDWTASIVDRNLDTLSPYFITPMSTISKVPYSISWTRCTKKNWHVPQVPTWRKDGFAGTSRESITFPRE